MNRIWPLFLLPVLFFQCNSGKHLPDNLPDKQLFFGDGGGITGGMTEYILLENGQLFKRNSLAATAEPGAWEELKRVKKKTAVELFEKFESEKFQSLSFEEPGNRYYFLGRVQEKELTRLTWGNPNFTLPDSVETFYRSLTQLIPKQ